MTAEMLSEIVFLRKSFFLSLFQHAFKYKGVVTVFPPQIGFRNHLYLSISRHAQSMKIDHRKAIDIINIIYYHQSISIDC